MNTQFTKDSLTSGAQYFTLQGKDLLKRTEQYYQWQQKLLSEGSWVTYKSNTSKPGPVTTGIDDAGRPFGGINFGTQDYLALSDHPEIKNAARQAIEEYGVHSAGSPATFGRNKYTNALANNIASFLGFKHGLIYTTGWQAGYGCIAGLTRPQDHIVIDKLAHNCLREGSYAGTKNVHFFDHLDNNHAATIIKKIRSQQPDAGILVVTEGLYSMDSDWPDLNELQQITKQYDCTLFLDIAHDFGCIGEEGRGQIELQNLRDTSNVIIMGSGSKTFATSFGYVCCNSPAVIEYLKVFSPSQIFTTSIIPIGAAIGLQALKIIQSEEGKLRRKQLMDNIVYMRNKLEEKGFQVYGLPTPIVPVILGNEGLTRITARLLLDKGFIVNPIEFPVVPRGKARFRLSMMQSHTHEQIDKFIDMFAICFKEAKFIIASMADVQINTIPKIEYTQPQAKL